MRGTDTQQQMMFSYISPEARVPKDHPLRPIQAMANKALRKLSPIFKEMYSSVGRRSIAPEKLLRSLLLQVLYSIRSERMLVEQLDYNLLFRWFVGLSMDEPIWDHSTYSKNRERLFSSDLAALFLQQITRQAEEAGLLSDEHFTVDGTLIEAWASLKSFRPKDTDSQHKGGGGRNPEVDFHGEKRRNDTHVSTTDPESKLFRKGQGKEAKLCFMGHVLMENRHGFVIDARVTAATGTAEREAALSMIKSVPGRHRITLGADKGYDTKEFVSDLRTHKVTPHVAQKKHSAIDARTTRHPGYELSLKIRKRVEEVFGWMKTVGLVRKSKYRGEEKVDWLFTFTAAAYNLTRLRNLEISASG